MNQLENWKKVCMKREILLQLARTRIRERISRR
jgi:hypothetical protein